MHTFPHFVYGVNEFYLQSTLLAHVFGLNKDTLHRIQQHGIVGELFVPDNRPRQDQQFGATEDDHEINNRFCLPRTRADNNNAIHANSPSPLTP